MTQPITHPSREARRTAVATGCRPSTSDRLADALLVLFLAIAALSAAGAAAHRPAAAEIVATVARGGTPAGQHR